MTHGSEEMDCVICETYRRPVRLIDPSWAAEGEIRRGWLRLEREVAGERQSRSRID